MMKLAERFVNAVESIAQSLAKLANPAHIVTTGTQTNTTAGGQNAGIDYPEEDNRDAWLLLAKNRNIEIPPRTKTPTIVKLVKDYDTAQAASPGNTTQANAGAEDDPFNEKADTTGGQDEKDPFGDNAADDYGNLTEADVRDALKTVLDKKSMGEVSGILKKHGGVEKIKDLTEDKYADVYKAAQDIIKEAA